MNKINLNYSKPNINLLNLPFFVFRKEPFKKRKKLFKLFFILNSYLVTLLFKLFEKQNFCYFMNIYFQKDGTIEYSKDYDLYLKNYNKKKIYYPNKFRIAGSMVNHGYEMNNLLDSYCLNLFEFEEEDVIVDCGANIGMFYLSLSEHITNFYYFGYEPDEKVFKCLDLNLENSKYINLKNVALSNTKTNKKFFLNSNSGDSSLEEFSTDQVIDIKTTTLDLENIGKIKLLKIDAEGHELEVLQGSKGSLNSIEFICIDMGGEKGDSKDTTLVPVTNFLLLNGFELIGFNPERCVGLFKNLN